MTSFIRKHVFSGSEKNMAAPYVFLVFLIFVFSTMVYYIALFEWAFIIPRAVGNVVMLIGYVVIERSSLKKDELAFVSPLFLVISLTILSLIYNGDFLIFQYTIGGGMIALTYSKPRGLAFYTLCISIFQAIIIISFDVNMLGASFTMAQNYAGFATAVILNVILYIYCHLYSAKGAFLANMSHEIRTPISSVLGISEIRLQTQNMSQEINESFMKIHSAAVVLLGIVNDMLDFSKLEDGKMEIRENKYESASMISNFAHLHYDSLKYKEISFNISIDETIPEYLIGDVLRIEQIMLNILSNAFKYTDQGFVDLTIQCRPLSGDNKMLIFTVKDTGVGMSKNQLDKVFNAYARFHEKTNNAIGAGLGMSIVHKIVNLMGGKIVMSSMVGQGTTITISIPQKAHGTGVIGKDTAARLQRFEAYYEKVSQSVKFITEPMPYGSVLLVDDIEANIYVAKGLLAFYDLKIETCFSGHEAIEKIREGKVYDIIFMDFMMPGLSGTETMHNLRSLGYTHPIIVLTADTMSITEEEYIKEGFDGYLSKPIITKILNDILIKFIKSKQPPEVIAAAITSGKLNQQDLEKYQRDADLLEKVRYDFAKSQRDSYKNLMEALGTNDNETAHHIAHSVKGLSHLINEPTLAQYAGEVENILDSGKIPANDLLQALEKELNYVINHITLQRKESRLSYSSVSTEETIELLKKIQPLLELRKAESINFVQELKEIPETIIIARQVEKFDFGNAFKSVNILLSVLEE